jgi:hypothetical protein
MPYGQYPIPGIGTARFVEFYGRRRLVAERELGLRRVYVLAPVTRTEDAER